MQKSSYNAWDLYKVRPNKKVINAFVTGMMVGFGIGMVIIMFLIEHFESLLNPDIYGGY